MSGLEEGLVEIIGVIKIILEEDKFANKVC